jgi:hypothetical protein
MAENIKLSLEEIENLKLKFDELSFIFEQNKEEFLKFKDAPVTYLRNFGLDVMKYLNYEVYPSLIRSFSRIIRNILRFRQVFDRCSWCKILALTIIYTTCGKARIAIDGLYGVLSAIIEAIEHIFDRANELVQDILDYLNNIADRLSPFEMAKFLCQVLNYCP